MRRFLSNYFDLLFGTHCRSDCIITECVAMDDVVIESVEESSSREGSSTLYSLEDCAGLLWGNKGVYLLLHPLRISLMLLLRRESQD